MNLKTFLLSYFRIPHSHFRIPLHSMCGAKTSSPQNFLQFHLFAQFQDIDLSYRNLAPMQGNFFAPEAIFVNLGSFQKIKFLPAPFGAIFDTQDLGNQADSH